MSKTVVVVPNWNGAESLTNCIDSLVKQTVDTQIIVVDNGSSDNSLEILKDYSGVEVIKHNKNKGYAGGVNPGFNWAIENNYDYVAAFNNDAVADKYWMASLVKLLDESPEVGIATSKILNEAGDRIDSTGDFYTVWGLPFPRGRDDAELSKYDKVTNIFAASGGASIYRVQMLEQIGILDEDFFAYYEDIDLSFRAQLSNWKIKYAPEAVVYHQIGATSSKIKGFATYQTMKNLPLLLYKNVPSRYLFKIVPRFTLAYLLFIMSSVMRLQIWPAVKGTVMALALMPGALIKRKKIQASKAVADEYIWEMLVHDLPPRALALRNLRSNWWSLRGHK